MRHVGPQLSSPASAALKRALRRAGLRRAANTSKHSLGSVSSPGSAPKRAGSATPQAALLPLARPRFAPSRRATRSRSPHASDASRSHGKARRIRQIGHWPPWRAAATASARLRIRGRGAHARCMQPLRVGEAAFTRSSWHVQGAPRFSLRRSRSSKPASVLDCDQLPLARAQRSLSRRQRSRWIASMSRM